MGTDKDRRTLRHILDFHHLAHPLLLQMGHYMFIVDDRELAEAIVCTGFPAVPILDYSTNEYDFSMDSFLGYLDSIAFSGTSHMDYVYVVACSSKMANRTLEDYFDRNSMLFVSGWRLFWKKEYLAKLDYQEELEKTGGPGEGCRSAGSEPVSHY